MLHQVASNEWTSLKPGSPLDRSRRAWGRRLEPPMLDTSDLAPLALWGDSAPMTKRDSLYLLLWSSLLPVCHRRFYIVCFTKQQLCRCGCAGRCTIDSALRVVVWAFQVMLSGKMPCVRHDSISFSESQRLGDRHRATKAGTNLRCRGFVGLTKGEWA